MAGRAWGRGLAVAAVFTFIGPLIGATLIMVVMAVSLMMVDPPNAVVTLLMWPFAAVLGMMIGFVPALMTGGLMAILSPRLKTRLAWIGASTICGMAATAVFYRLADLGADLMIAFVCGGGAAVACALITLGWRPR